MPTLPGPSAGRLVRRAAVAVVLVVLLLSGLLADPAAAQHPPDTRSPTAGDDVSYLPPVDAPVADPFRPPRSPYGPGNRGLAYDLPAGTPVRASADGIVVYAGTVAGTRHVTVLHRDGLRTSYSFLTEVAVRRGQALRQGDVVGRGGTGFHLGVRDGDAYLDPAALFDAHQIHVRLVPHTEPLPPTDAGLLREQASLRDLVRAERPGFLERMWSAVADHGAPILGRVADVGLAAWHSWRSVDPVTLVADAVESLVRHLRQPCTPSSVAVTPPEPGERVAVLVGGLGSTSTTASIDDVDVDVLGYDRRDVLRYRYGGGRVPDDGVHPALRDITAAHYDAAATLGDIETRGRELADLIQETAAARPGRPIDLYAHSMGGLVTRVALRVLDHRLGGLDVLGEVVTIATPHSGADLATLAEVSEPGYARPVGLARQWAGIDIDPYSTAVRQMSESSGFIDRLRTQPVPEDVSLRTIGAAGDLVVTADKSDIDGQRSAIVGLVGADAHADVPGAAATTRELQLALAGRPPACQGFLGAVTDAVLPEAISGITDVGGLVMLAAG